MASTESQSYFPADDPRSKYPIDIQKTWYDQEQGEGNSQTGDSGVADPNVSVAVDDPYQYAPRTDGARADAFNDPSRFQYNPETRAMLDARYGINQPDTLAPTNVINENIAPQADGTAANSFGQETAIAAGGVGAGEQQNQAAYMQSPDYQAFQAWKQQQDTTAPPVQSLPEQANIATPSVMPQQQPAPGQFPGLGNALGKGGFQGQRQPMQGGYGGKGGFQGQRPTAPPPFQMSQDLQNLHTPFMAMANQEQQAYQDQNADSINAMQQWGQQQSQQPSFARYNQQQPQFGGKGGSGGISGQQPLQEGFQRGGYGGNYSGNGQPTMQNQVSGMMGSFGGGYGRQTPSMGNSGGKGGVSNQFGGSGSYGGSAGSFGGDSGGGWGGKGG